jgi:hypothetical protein
VPENEEVREIDVVAIDDCDDRTMQCDSTRNKLRESFEFDTFS